MEPTTLVLRKSDCFYCKAPMLNDCQITHMFGIRYCAEHEDWAFRDCTAWVHSHMKEMDSIYNFEFFLEKGRNIFIRRSNGDIERGWRIEHFPFMKDATSWKFRVYSKDNVTKLVRFDMFDDPELSSKNCPEFTNLARQIHESIKESVCTCETCEEFAKTTPIKPIEETPGVSTVIGEDGRAFRIFKSQ